MQAVTKVNSRRGPEIGNAGAECDPLPGKAASAGGCVSDVDRPRSCRGIGGGMQATGDFTQHGKPRVAGATACSQPDAREGQTGPPGVTERLVVPMKPANPGGGKGPWLEADARSDEGPREIGR